MVKFLIGAAPLALIASGASAQTLPVQAVVTGAAADPVAADPVSPEGEQANVPADVVVLGFGQSRQVQTVTAADLDRLTPGTSPGAFLSYGRAGYLECQGVRRHSAPCAHGSKQPTSTA